MTPTVNDIKARYPEFASMTDPQIQLAIDDAVPWFDEFRWGEFYAQGFAAFVAHTVAGDKATAGGKAGGLAGAIQSKKVGDVDITYASTNYSNASDSAFGATQYGRRYLQLRRLVGVGAVAV